jgi:hypothetical protein
MVSAQCLSYLPKGNHEQAYHKHLQPYTSIQTLLLSLFNMDFYWDVAS